MASEHEPTPDFSKAALEILSQTSETTHILMQQMDDLEVDVWKRAMEEELGRFTLANLGDAQTMLEVPKPDKLTARIRRYTTAHANRMLLAQTWSSLVEQRNEELGELLLGKRITAKRLSAQTHHPFRFLYTGATGNAPGNAIEISGEVIDVDANLSEVCIRDESAGRYGGIPGIEMIGWSIRAFDSDGTQLIDLRPEDSPTS